ncbi:MAG TPA: response regulator [Thermoplasmata archaeon]|nr:response regulator [Thermoplasmata archaeon]
MRILVVDDDSVFREEFASFLLDDGHVAATAASAVKAVDALEQGEFDVVFTDLKMPRESGLDLLRTIRARWPRQFVVVVTGYASVTTAVEAMKLGAFDYVGKPFRTDQVRKVLELVGEQRKYDGHGLDVGDAVALAKEIAAHGAMPVLLAAPPPAPKVLPKGIEFVPFDGRDPARLSAEVTSFLETHPRAGVVLAHAESLFQDRRTEDVVSWLTSVRELLRDRGVLAVGLDPAGLTDTQAKAVTEVVAAAAVHGTLEALANPIRRRVLRRLTEGPSTFSTLMRAADLDDSPKMSFHMHRLVEEGLIARTGEEYRLTDQGRAAAGVIRQMETSVGGRAGSTLLFRPPKRPAPHR